MDIEQPDDGPPTLCLEFTSVQARLISELLHMGVYGNDAEEIVLRFLDEKLAEFVVKPTLHLGDHKGG